MKSLFKVTMSANKKSVDDAGFTSRDEAKVYRDSLNKSAGWLRSKADEPDNCNTMPFIVRKDVGHPRYGI